MKIIHVLLGKANPYRMNGVNRVVHNLAQTQCELGLDVEVWGITPDPETQTSKRIYKLRLFRYYRQNKMVKDPDLVDAIAKAPHDSVFHLHGGFIRKFYRLSQLINSLGYKYVFTPHGTFTRLAMSKNKLLKKLYFKFFERKILEKAKAVQMLGHCELDDLKRIYKKNNLILIPNGQVPEKLPDVVNGTEVPLLGYCGRINRLQKGLDLLLEGFEIYVKDKRGTGKLMLIGNGEYLQELKQMVKDKGLADRVEFMGEKFDTEKLSLIASMHAFYHTSRNEGLPTAVLEAASLNVPIVVSRFTSMDTYVEDYDSGIVLHNNTPKEIAQSMSTVESFFMTEQWKQKGMNARLMVEKEFDWEKIAESLDKVYNS